MASGCNGGRELGGVMAPLPVRRGGDAWFAWDERLPSD